MQEVREADVLDKSVILKLIKSYSQYDAKYAKRCYDKYFSNDPMMKEDLVLVAEVENGIVGVIGYSEDYFSNNYSYHLEWFVVAQKYRGWKDGIVAFKLLEALEKDLRRYKVRKLFVSCEARPDRCHGFYLKHGFQFEARLRDYYGRGDDQIMFGKKLDGRGPVPHPPK